MKGGKRYVQSRKTLPVCLVGRWEVHVHLRLDVVNQRPQENRVRARREHCRQVPEGIAQGQLKPVVNDPLQTGVNRPNEFLRNDTSIVNGSETQVLENAQHDPARITIADTVAAVEVVLVATTLWLDVRAPLAHAKLGKAVAGHVVAAVALQHHRMAARALLAHLAHDTDVHVVVRGAKDVHDRVRAIRTANTLLHVVHEVVAAVNAARVKLVAVRLDVLSKSALRKPPKLGRKDRAAAHAGDRGHVQNMPLHRRHTIELLVATDADTRRLANLACLRVPLNQTLQVEVAAAGALSKLDTLGLENVNKGVELFGVLPRGLKGRVVETVKDSRQLSPTHRRLLLAPRRVDQQQPLLEREALLLQLERLVQNRQRLLVQELKVKTKEPRHPLKRVLDLVGVQVPLLKEKDESRNLTEGALDIGDAGNMLRCLPHGQVRGHAVKRHLVSHDRVPSQQFLEHFLDTLDEGNLGVQKFREEDDEVLPRQAQAKVTEDGQRQEVDAVLRNILHQGQVAGIDVRATVRTLRGVRNGRLARVTREALADRQELGDQRQNLREVVVLVSLKAGEHRVHQLRKSRPFDLAELKNRLVVRGLHRVQDVGEKADLLVEKEVRRGFVFLGVQVVKPVTQLIALFLGKGCRGHHHANTLKERVQRGILGLLHHPENAVNQLEHEVAVERENTRDDGVNGRRRKVENLKGNTTLADDVGDVVTGGPDGDGFDATNTGDRQLRHLPNKGAGANGADRNAGHVV